MQIWLNLVQTRMVEGFGVSAELAKTISPEFVINFAWK
jgi:hypothetical protein